jgi:Protein of unknown function (DUF4238)
MPSDKQHIVPRFYFRPFSADGRRLNLYNLQRNKKIVGAPLKGQCYRRGVYETPEFEKILSRHEARLAPVVARITATAALPSDLQDYFLLLQLVASLHLRPAAALEEMNAGIDLLLKDIFSRTGPYTRKELDLVQIKVNAGPMLAANVHRAGRALLDLTPVLVKAPDGTEWITSDHPLIAYNTYTEELPENQPGHGLVTRGIQLFLPLSPRLLCVLYDDAIYRPREQGDLLATTHQDVDSMNFLQAAYAQENLYFLNDSESDFLALHRRARDARTKRRAFVSRYARADQELEEDGTRSEIMHSGTTMPNLHLRLGFLSLRKSAARTPRDKRFGYRPQPPDPDEDMEAHRNADRLVGRRYALLHATHRNLLDP